MYTHTQIHNQDPRQYALVARHHFLRTLFMRLALFSGATLSPDSPYSFGYHTRIFSQPVHRSSLTHRFD